MPADSPAKEESNPIRLPGALSVWQAVATGFAGMMLTSVIATNKLEERSIADQRNIANLQGEVRSMNSQIQTLAVEVARLSQQVASSTNSNTNPTSGNRQRGSF
jgi:uncharacterized protein YlxW (UPF0749 family)